MAIAHVNTQTGTATTPGTTITVTAPSSLANGHVVYAVVAIRAGSGGVPADPTSNHGFSFIGSTGNSTQDTNLSLWRKVITNAAGESSSYTWSVGANRGWAVSASAFSGVDNATPEDNTFSGASDTTANTTHEHPAVTTVTSGAFALGATLCIAGTRSAPSLLTEIADVTSTGTNPCSLWLGAANAGVVGTPGTYPSVGTGQVTCTNSHVSCGLIIPLRPGVNNTQGTALLDGGGVLTAVGTREVIGTALLDAGGVLTATGAREVIGAAVLDAGGVFTAIGAGTLTGTALLSGGGTFTAVGEVSEAAISITEDEADAALIEIEGTPIVLGTATLAAGGVFTAVGEGIVLGTAQLDAGGTFTAVGQRRVYGTALLDAGGELTAVGTNTSALRRAITVDLDDPGVLDLVDGGALDLADAAALDLVDVGG